MNQETENAVEKSWDDILRRPLKSVSVQQIESAFEKALQELTGQAFKVDLRKLDLNPELNAWITDTALIDLKVSKRTDDDGKGPFSA